MGGDILPLPRLLPHGEPQVLVAGHTLRRSQPALCRQGLPQRQVSVSQNAHTGIVKPIGKDLFKSILVGHTAAAVCRGVRRRNGDDRQRRRDHHHRQQDGDPFLHSVYHGWSPFEPRNVSVSDASLSGMQKYCIILFGFCEVVFSYFFCFCACIPQDGAGKDGDRAIPAP